jgi:predicted transcriptional regulator
MGRQYRMTTTKGTPEMSTAMTGLETADWTWTGDDPAVAWVTIDPNHAGALLEANEANRNIRQRVVSAYARDMEHDKWLTTGETIKIGHHGELLDGQHRLHAIIASGTPQRLLVVRGLDPATRTVIDTGAVRTGGDALRMAGIGGGNPYALASAARMLVLWQGGRLTHMTSGNRGEDRATHQEIVEAVTNRPDLLDAVHDATRDYQRIGIPPGPQAMARLVLADLDAGDAMMFFDSLAGYATEGSDDPRAVLLFTIRQMRELGQLRRPGESIGLIFMTWNAWRDKQKIKTLSVRDHKGRPLKIPLPV